MFVVGAIYYVYLIGRDILLHLVVHSLLTCLTSDLVV